MAVPKPKNDKEIGLTWSFLTHHAHVLLLLSQDHSLRLRDCARMIGITERAVQNIVSDLENVGVLKRNRSGRRNHYEINKNLKLPHDVEKHLTAGDLIQFAPELGKLDKSA